MENKRNRVEFVATKAYDIGFLNREIYLYLFFNRYRFLSLFLKICIFLLTVDLLNLTDIAECTGSENMEEKKRCPSMCNPFSLLKKIFSRNNRVAVEVELTRVVSPENSRNIVTHELFTGGFMDSMSDLEGLRDAYERNEVEEFVNRRTPNENNEQNPPRGSFMKFICKVHGYK